MRMRSGLYPVGPTLQRERLADLLGLDPRLIAIIAELVGFGVLVQRAGADYPLAAVQHSVAKCWQPGRIVALEKPRGAALTIADLGQRLGVLQVLLVLIAIGRRLGILVAVAKREGLGALRALDPHHVLKRACLIDVAIPVREQRYLDRREIGGHLDRPAWRSRRCDRGRRCAGRACTSACARS